MKCPFCGDPGTQVTETRENDAGDVVRRRRRCTHCNQRFTTYERVELKTPYVIKRNGSRAEFQREKLAASLALALRKRPVPREAIENAIERIEAQLLTPDVSEVPSARIGELVMQELKQLDKVAYVRYASVYRNFTDVDEFTRAIREVRPRKRSDAGKADDLFGN